MRFPFVVLVLVALPLSGVLAEDAGDGGTAADGETGIIRGIVVDETFHALPGANVTVRELDLLATTDATGRYSFEGLAPGVYTLVVTKPGYQLAGKQTELEAGQELQVDFILVSLPPPRIPHLVEMEFHGRIGCSVAFGFLQSADHCAGVMGVQVDPAAGARFNFTIDTGLTDLVVVVDSTPGPFGTADLLMEWFTPVAAIPALHGPVPLRGDYAFDPAGNPWVEEPSPGTFHVKADPHADTPQLAYQQDVAVFLGLFYNGAPVPPDYSPVPDA